MERPRLYFTRKLALQYAPKQIAKCGDIVTAQWGGWKKPHKVMVTKVAVEVSDIGLTIGQRAEKGIIGWLTVQHQYIGRRIKTNGELTGSPSVGFLLCEFTTSDGQKFERISSGFNHVGLVFDIEGFDRLCTRSATCTKTPTTCTKSRKGFLLPFWEVF